MESSGADPLGDLGFQAQTTDSFEAHQHGNHSFPSFDVADGEWLEKRTSVGGLGGCLSSTL